MKGISGIKSAGLGCFPCKQNKHPIVEKGQDWRVAAFLPEDKLDKSNIWGVLIPPRILIIDLDLYKINEKLNRKITREDVDNILNCKLPWDQSLIQKTQRGGEHHAFLVDFNDYPASIKQENGRLLEGFDTKVTGKGYICFGHKYTEVGSGIVGLSNPGGFPRLPDAAYEVLRRDFNRYMLPSSPIIKIDLDELTNVFRVHEALTRIDPDCGRDRWRNIGFALKHGFGDDPRGFEFWNRWSRGDFSGKGIPKKYIEQDIIKQWKSFKQDKEGGITIKSLYRYASEPMSMDEISELVGKHEPVDPSPHSPTIIHVNNIPPREITDHPITDKNKTKYVDEECVSKILKGAYGDRFISLDGIPRWWSGREWEYLRDTDLINFLFDSLPKRYRDMNRIKRIREAFLHRIPKIDTPEPSKKIFFRDGVLDLYSGKFEPHKKENYNIGTLSVNYGDKCSIVEWEKFLISMFGSLNDDRVKLLQEIMLWLLIHHNLGIEKYIAFVGASRAGKGLILKLLGIILGSGFCGSFNFDALGTVQGHDALWEYQVLIDSEAKAPKRDDKVSTLATIQKVTSDEIISSRRFRENEYRRGKVNCKIIIACNNLPVFTDNSGASVSRVIILKFTKSFSGKEDFNLYKRLSKETVGIVHWALEARERMIANNWVFTKPESSVEEMTDLESLSIPLSGFIEDYLIFDPGYKISTDDLYEAYKIKRSMDNLSIWDIKTFRKMLKDTLLGKDVKWGQYMINGKRVQGAKGIKIVNPASMPGAPLPPTPMKG